MSLDPSNVNWSRNHFGMMHEGATWGVPRSGLVFTRRGNELHLVLRMPHDPAMPITAPELKKFQDADFEGVKENFGAAGVVVVDQTK